MTDLTEAIVAAIAPIIDDRVEMVERETETSIEINGAYLAAECAAAVLAVPEVALREKALRWAAWSWCDGTAFDEPECPTVDEFGIVIRSFGFEWSES